MRAILLTVILPLLGTAAGRTSHRRNFRGWSATAGLKGEPPLGASPGLHVLMARGDNAECDSTALAGLRVLFTDLGLTELRG